VAALTNLGHAKHLCHYHVYTVNIYKANGYQPTTNDGHLTGKHCDVPAHWIIK